MKKAMITVGLMLGIGFTQMTAQNVSFGAKVETNASNFILSDLGSMKSKLRMGTSVGGFAKFDLGENFALQPELLFHFKRSNSKIDNSNNSYRYWGAEIPVYALGQWDCGNGKIYAGIGPYAALGFSAKYHNNDFDLYKKIGSTDKRTLRRFDFGFGAIFGYEFSNRIQVNAGYKIGALNAMDAGRKDSKMHPQTISLGLAYRF